MTFWLHYVCRHVISLLPEPIAVITGLHMHCLPVMTTERVIVFEDEGGGDIFCSTNETFRSRQKYVTPHCACVAQWQLCIPHPDANA